MGKAIGIDIGTTSISGVVLEEESGKVLKSRTIPNNSFQKTEHPWERIQDAEMIIETAKGLLDDLLILYPDSSFIGLTGQMHGILYLNRHGKCISPLYTWQDGRGELPEFQGKTLVQVIKNDFGVNLSTGYGLATHLYHCKKGQVPPDSVSLCTIADYLGMVLTGRKTPLMHAGNAASLGFYSVKQQCFQEEIIRNAGMDTGILPPVSEKIELLGTYSPDKRQPRDSASDTPAPPSGTDKNLHDRKIPVAIAIGDNQASFLGAAGLKENTVLVNMGTGGQISLLSSQYLEIPGIETRPLLKDKYLLVGASLCGGRAYAILENFFRSYASILTGEKSAQYNIMEKLAEKAAVGQNGLKVRTTFQGTRENPRERGSITGISEENFTPENLIAGTLEGMAEELHDMYLKIYRETRIPAEHLVASGNGLRKNPLLQEIFRKMFEAELSLSPYEEEAACGAALTRLWKGK